MRTLAIVPVKRFELAKLRLGAVLSAARRQDLAQAMVEDVLDALRTCAALEATLVVSSEPRIVDLAERAGARIVHDPHESGQTAAAVVGVARAVAEGFDRALLLPGDCPALDPGELHRLVCDAQTAVVVIPDRHGTGTNGLLLTPPGALMPAFGPGSAQRHRERAAAAGAACRVTHVGSLLLDVDTPDDLEALRETLEPRDGRAPRTSALLAGW